MTSAKPSNCIIAGTFTGWRPIYFFKEKIKFFPIEAIEAGIESSWLDNCYDHQEQFYDLKMMNNQTEAGELITNFSRVGEQW